VSSPDTVQVNVNAADGVKILPEDAERISKTLASKIDARKLANAGATEAHTYEVDLHPTRYEKGNATARRARWPGRIHSEGKVSVFQIPGHTLVGEFDLKKTLAWGGVPDAGRSRA
jgi:hypothetical protein